MLLEILHQANPYGGDSKLKIYDTMHLFNIADFSYRINVVDNEYITIMFIINNGEKDRVCSIDFKCGDISVVIDFCRHLFKELEDQLDYERNRKSITSLILNFTKPVPTIEKRYA